MRGSSRERDFYRLGCSKGHLPSFGGFEVTEADRSTNKDFTFLPLFKSELVKGSNTLHQEESAIQCPLSRLGLEAGDGFLGILNSKSSSRPFFLSLLLLGECRGEKKSRRQFSTIISFLLGYCAATKNYAHEENTGIC